MICIHTLKCGRSFVASAFGRRLEVCPTFQWQEATGHKTYLENREIFRKRQDNIDDYMLFSVIRNPWDWHLSWYSYVSKDIGGKRSGMVVEHQQISYLRFSDYIRWLDDCDVLRSRDDYMRRRISDWIVDEHQEITIPNILRQENLEAELTDLWRRYHLMIDIPLDERINASRDRNGYRWAYSDDDAEVVARRHARDMAKFGYSF